MTDTSHLIQELQTFINRIDVGFRIMDRVGETAVPHPPRTAPPSNLIKSDSRPSDLLSTGKLGTLTEQGQTVLSFANADADILVRLMIGFLVFDRLRSGTLTMAPQSCMTFQIPRISPNAS